MKKRGRFDESVEAVLEHVKGFVLAVFVTVAVLSVVVGYRYYRYTQDEPQFCASCHLMQDAFAEWQKGKHRDVVCQQCHQLSILEKNRLLVAYVVRGNQPLAQTHGREKPWKACKGCHMDIVAQGSVTTNKAYGHARHVFMQELECKVCHKVSLHNFHPDEASCQSCHKDKGVHGIGMEAFSCLKCHPFNEKKPVMVSKGQCVRCHTGIADKGPMSGFPCYQCHKPHGNINQPAVACAGMCHKNESSVGQHKLHAKQGLVCTYCHKPHAWIVSKESAKALCGSCHPPKDPQRFVY